MYIFTKKILRRIYEKCENIKDIIGIYSDLPVKPIYSVKKLT